MCFVFLIIKAYLWNILLKYCQIELFCLLLFINLIMFCFIKTKGQEIKGHNISSWPYPETNNPTV